MWFREEKQAENAKLKAELERAQKQLEEVKITYDELREKDNEYAEFDDTTTGSVKSFDT